MCFFAVMISCTILDTPIMTNLLHMNLLNQRMCVWKGRKHKCARSKDVCMLKNCDCHDPYVQNFD